MRVANLVARTLVALWIAVAAMSSIASAQDAAPSAPPPEEAVPAEEADAAATPPPEVEEVPTIAVRSAPKSEDVPEEQFTPGDAARLDEITVTASKRQKSQRDIPASVGAFRGEDLEKINAQSIKDYLKTIPGVQLVEKDQDRTAVTIRGISVSTDFSLNTTAGTVGIFIDELPLNDAFRQLTVPDLNPFDLERVEVLKGPQGTLFGAGALSGAIRYITKKPDMGVWNSKAQLTYSDNKFGEPRQFVGAALNIPVYRDEAAIRVAINYLDRGGMIDKLSSFEGPDSIEDEGVPEGMRDQRFQETDNGKDVDSLLQYTGRVTGQWNATEALRFNLLAIYQQSKFADTAQVDNFDGDFNSRNDPTASPGDSSFGALNFVPSYAFDWGTLTSSTGYVTKEFVTNTSVLTAFGEETVLPPDDEPGDDLGTEELGTVATKPIPFGGKQNGIIQEFRLSSPEDSDSHLEWLTGVSYYKSKQYYFNTTPTSAELADFRNGLAVDQCPAPICPVPTPVGNVNGREYEIASITNDSQGEEMALFGEATYKFFDDERLELTFGARLFRNRLKVFLEGRGITSSVLVGRASYQENFDYSESGFNPKFSARYILTPDIQTYVLAAKGFQFGGVQVAPPLSGREFIVPEEVVTSYKSSKLWLYEWGWRTDWFERRLRFDWTAYYYDWSDLQLGVDNLLPNPLPKDPEFPNDVPVFEDGVRDEQTRRRPFGSYITNLGRARSTGLEASLSVRPGGGFNFTSSVNWLKAQLTEDYVGPDGATIPKGRTLAGAPNFQMSNSLSYSSTFNLPFNFLGEWEGGASLTHTHVSETASDLFENRSADHAPEGTEKFDTVGAQLHVGKPNWYGSPDLRFTISNITDVRAIQGVSGTNAGRNLKVYYNQPRTAILALDVKF